MISKLLRDSALQFIEAEKKAIAYWSNYQRSRGNCCPVKKSDFEQLIKGELQSLKASEKIAA
ncbi:hypothetical protein [Synechococcus sp. PCC 7502]|uniref:hypothetical protein n=1 Tax=Synechococcus sp. PCC 7502 TaxID=1173263 RepID=UPI00059E192C|nr:hypothetical protein [Synechococcus sp. PCC 7502]